MITTAIFPADMSKATARSIYLAKKQGALAIREWRLSIHSRSRLMVTSFKSH
jgi:hypothetical protein